MRTHLVLGGVIVTTIPEVLDAYHPRHNTVPEQQWKQIRPLVTTAVAAADFQTLHSAAFALRITTRFVRWAQEQDCPLDPEAIFLPDLVDRFIGAHRNQISGHTLANYRSALRTVSRANTKKAPWAPLPPVLKDHPHVTAPYSDADVDGFWEAARSQATPRRTRVLTAMLVLGLGAGLKPREVLDVTADRHVRCHPDDSRLWVITLQDRIVPVLDPYVEPLRDLGRAYPTGPLIGPSRADTKDPFGMLRRGIQIPARLPALRLARLRTTWMVNLLRNDVRISEFMTIAGTASSATLEHLAPYLGGRWDDNLYLFKAAGLR